MQELSSIVRKKIIKYYCAPYVTLRLLQHPRTMPTVILIMEWTLPDRASSKLSRGLSEAKPTGCLPTLSLFPDRESS